MKNTTLPHKIACSIVFGLYAAVNVYLLTLLYTAANLGIELSAWPVVLISLTVVICITTIIGIWKNNKVLLIIGLLLAALKLLDTVSSFVNLIFFDQQITVWIPIVTGLLFLYAFIVILRGIRQNKTV